MAAVSRGNVPAVSPTGGRVAPKFELYEQVELEGVGGKWWTGRYILTRVFDQGIWWYGITHPYQGNSSITQLSAVVEFPEHCLRHPENSEKLKVTGGIYNAEKFLGEYGKSILKAGVTRANVSPVSQPTPEDEQAAKLASSLAQCQSKAAIASLMQQFQVDLSMLRKVAPRVVQAHNLESVLRYKQISQWLFEIENGAS